MDRVTPISHEHPCFNEQAHSRYGRLHLPVADRCNIGCGFCDRKIGSKYHSSRPGVSSKVISPAESLVVIDQVLVDRPDLRVIGISGPGEPLFNPETYETLELVTSRHPEMRLCICTNGLLLPDEAGRLGDLGVEHLTITINAVDPIGGTRINSHCLYNGQTYRGREAAGLLIDNQLKGLEMAVSLGMIVKVTTVLIPSVNTGQVRDIADEVKRRGASLMNLMPLIPLGQMSRERAPTCAELNQARDACEPLIPVFRLCKQCRADACGIPGDPEREGWL